MTLISALSRAIHHVVGSSAQPQMIWPNTARIVAVMQHAKCAIKRTVGHFIRVAMGTSLVAVNHETAVTAAIHRTRPIPTAFGFVDSLPKFFAHAPSSIIGAGLVNA